MKCWLISWLRQHFLNCKQWHFFFAWIMLIWQPQHVSVNERQFAELNLLTNKIRSSFIAMPFFIRLYILISNWIRFPLKFCIVSWHRTFCEHIVRPCTKWSMNIFGGNLLASELIFEKRMITIALADRNKLPGKIQPSRQIRTTNYIAPISINKRKKVQHTSGRSYRRRRTIGYIHQRHTQI